MIEFSVAVISAMAENSQHETCALLLPLMVVMCVNVCIYAVMAQNSMQAIKYYCYYDIHVCEQVK